MTNPHAPAETFDARPAAVRRWRANLPRANTGELSRQLYHALCSVNRQQLSSKHRLHFLEAINEPLNEVLRALHKHYAGKPVPLSRKRQKVADLYYQLLKQTIIGHQKLITSSLELGRFGWKQTVTTAIHRIFGYQSLLLLNARQLYHPAPKGLWQQIYWLYMQSENHKLLNAKVATAGEGARKTSLATEFNKLLLHSLLCPSLFKLDELEEVLGNMAHWAAQVRVSNRIKPNQTHVYAFKLNTDVPPGLMADADPDHPAAGEEDEAVRFLLMDELVRHLQKLTRQAQPGVSRVRIGRQRSLGRRALLLLSNTWARPAARQSKRKPAHGEVEMAIGMSAIHYIIGGGSANKDAPAHPPPPPPGEQGVQDIFVPVEDEPPPPQQRNRSEFIGERDGQYDVWESAYFVPEPSPPSWTESIQMKAYSYQQARLMNISNGGFCVRLDRENVERIQLNEWVAVRHRQGPWILGAIRWLLCPTQGPVRAGIETLSVQVQPALLHLQTDNPHAQPIRCLLGNNGRSPMLYLPNLPVNLQGRLLNLEANGRTSSITLHDQVFTTPLGSAHHIERHDLPAGGDRDRDNDPAAEPYAAIWANL